MTDLAHVCTTALQAFGSPEQAELTMLPLPQAECPVAHYFGPGIAIREVCLPAGTIAVGHRQKFAHTNILLRGKVVMLQDDGTLRTLEAPMMFVGQPGRKVGYVLEDTVWQNIYATNITDANEIEAHFVEKSEAWRQHELTNLAEQQFSCAADRADFHALLSEYGLTAEQVRAQAENADDQITVACGIVRVHDSAIEGKGLFVTAPVEAGAVILPARLAGRRTQAGRYVNHSMTPNCAMVLRDNGDIDLVALYDLTGCLGGSAGEELTIDYRQALALSGVKAIGVEEPVCQP